MDNKAGGLHTELMNKYEYMRCVNSEVFKQRLQWLSEGMLRNHIMCQGQCEPNLEEIRIYNEYRLARARIEQGL